jgi:hypothetical protein
MAPLDIDWIATAALASWLGWGGPKSFKSATGLCLLMGLLGWAASYLIMVLSPSVGGDTALAEDYIDGFGVRNAAIELAVALGWTFLRFGLVRVVLVIGRAQERAA